MIVKWLIVGWLALGALLTVSNVDKPRPPISPAVASITVVITTAWIVAVVLWWRS